MTMRTKTTMTMSTKTKTTRASDGHDDDVDATTDVRPDGGAPDARSLTD